MPRHRCHDEQFRLAGRRAVTRKMFQLTERLAAFDLLDDCNRLAVDNRRIQAEIGFAARHDGMGKHIERRSNHRADAQIRKRIGRAVQPVGLHLRHIACTRQPVFLNFIPGVQHR